MMGVAKNIVARACSRNVGKFYQIVNKVSAENLHLFHADIATENNVTSAIYGLDLLSFTPQIRTIITNTCRTSIMII